MTLTVPAEADLRATMGDMVSRKPRESAETPKKHTTKGAGGPNPSGPPVFAQSTELNDLLRKFPMVSLRIVAAAAGFQNPSILPTEGLPNKVCLQFLC
jgi:hypothetical protein